MLASDGYAVVDGFLGASAAEALLAEVEALHQAEPSPFTQGRTGGGAGGGGRKFAAPVVRGDVIAVLGEGEEGKVAGLGALLRQLDELVKCMAHSAAPELLRVTSRSQPMLACYPGNGSRYVRHIDNPGGGWGGGGGGGGGGRGGGNGGGSDGARDNGRLLTRLFYLYPGWVHADGGVLRLHREAPVAEGGGGEGGGGEGGAGEGSGGEGVGGEGSVDVEPLLDRLVCFWSDARTPHEVLPAARERLAVSTWYHHRLPSHAVATVR